MRTFLYLCAAFVLLAGFASISFAGEYAKFKFIGFSKDGKYLAFEEYGVYDGSGADFSTTYFVDTIKNSFVFPPVEIVEGEEYTAAEKRANAAKSKKQRLAIAANLRKLNIVANNTGDLLVANLPTDLSYANDESSEENTSIVKFSNFVYTNGDPAHYELILKNVPAAGDERCRDINDAFKLELALEYKIYADSPASQLLERDTVLPERRRCPFGYSIERVYFYENKIAVFLNYYYQGFEGRSMRYMVVTAQMDYEPVKEW